MNELIAQLNTYNSGVLVEMKTEKIVELYFAKDYKTFEEFVRTLTSLSDEEIVKILPLLSGDNAQFAADAAQEWMDINSKIYLDGFPNITESKNTPIFKATEDMEKSQGMRSIAWFAALFYDAISKNHYGYRKFDNSMSYYSWPVCVLKKNQFYRMFGLPPSFDRDFWTYKETPGRKLGIGYEKIDYDIRLPAVQTDKLVHVWTKTVLNRLVAFVRQNEPIAAEFYTKDSAIFFKRYLKRLLHLANCRLTLPINEFSYVKSLEIEVNPDFLKSGHFDLETYRSLERFLLKRNPKNKEKYVIIDKAIENAEKAKIALSTDYWTLPIYKKYLPGYSNEDSQDSKKKEEQ